MRQWTDIIPLQDAALLDATAWMPLLRATTDSASVPGGALALDVATAPGLVRIAINLVIVLGVIVALAFVVRRTGAVRSDAGDALHVRSSLALGPKERLLIVEADGQRVLVGASAGGLTALHVLSADGAEATRKAAQTDQVHPKPVFKLPREVSL